MSQINSTSVLRMSASNLLRQMLHPVRVCKSWGFNYTPEAIFELNVPVMEYITHNVFGNNAMSLNGECEEHLLQLGRAIAQIGFWSVIRIDDTDTVKAYMMRHNHNGRQIRAELRKEKGVPFVYEKGDKGRFEIHGITYMLWHNISKEQGIAWSKYHMIGWLLANLEGKINVVGGDYDTIVMHIMDGFFREMWVLCGYASADYPCANHVTMPAELTVGC